LGLLGFGECSMSMRNLYPSPYPHSATASDSSGAASVHVAAQILETPLRAGIVLELDPLTVGMMRGERAPNTAAAYTHRPRADLTDGLEMRG
jgi:hypothetical protein